MRAHRPLTLLILDGWGHTEETEYNAIHHAKPPVWNDLWERYPHTFLNASGSEVGLPADQMGNSEVGHLNLGSGRVIYQEYTRIGRALRTGSFYENITLTSAVDKAAQQGKAVHIFGMLSPGGVHSHEDHIMAMFDLAARRGAQKIYLHAFMDGRDMPPKSAAPSVRLAMEKCQQLQEKGIQCGIATMCGRYYAMDRDNRWERMQASYDAITLGKAEFNAPDAMVALEQAYARGETDEFINPTVIEPRTRMEDGDSVIFMNFRSDRARQLTRTFIEPGFDGFPREYVPQLATFVSITQYNKEFDIPVAFPPEKLNNVFGEYISRCGLHQLRIAETEKYAHVTFFFNGGKEVPYEGEDRVLIPSPPVKTYDLKPEMSAYEVTDKLVEAILRKTYKYDVIICNLANADMVGHTGDFDASIKAILALDHCIKRICDASREVGGDVLITADHGNIEKMRDNQTNQAHTAHTMNLVPFLYVGERPARMNGIGVLADVAPTMLALMGLEQPQEMSGHSLIELLPVATEIAA